MNIIENIKFINRMTYLIGSIAAVIVLCSIIYYGCNTWFWIKQINITGDTQHININAVSQIARNSIHDNLITLDLQELQVKFNHLPWIRQVVIYRQFPNVINIVISEYVAIAQLSNHDLISPVGTVFGGDELHQQDLPIFNVPINELGEAIKRYTLINQALQPHHVTISKLFMNGYGLTKITLSNNLSVVICGINIQHSIQILNTYWNKLYNINSALSDINMCYKNAIAINSNKVFNK